MAEQREYKKGEISRRVNGVKRLVFFLVFLTLLIPLVGCDAIGSVGTSPMTAIKAEVTNILFSSNPKATHVVFDVEVKPNGAKAGVTYYVCLLSRDGYYFELQNKLVRWTEEELQGPDKDERDYNKIKQAEERQIKRFKLGAPLNDKAIAALNEDCKLEAERIAEEYARELQSAIKAGDLVELFKVAGKGPEVSREEINRIFDRHLKLVVTDKEGFIKIKYPDGETDLLAVYSGKGSFKTPNFTPKYERLKIALLSPTGCRGEGGVYHADGKGVAWGTLTVKPNNEGRTSSVKAKPGKEYYYSFTVPDDMTWELTIEASNMDSWVDD